MGKREKLKTRLDSFPKNFTWDELVSLLNYYGFEQFNAKRGSGRKFYNSNTGTLISCHEPHPDNIVKKYVLEDVKHKLDEIDINE